VFAELADDVVHIIRTRKGRFPLLALVEALAHRRRSITSKINGQ
jgi:hypothetical protein